MDVNVSLNHTVSHIVTKVQDEVFYSSKRSILRKSVSSSDTSLYTIPLINMLFFVNSFPHLGIQCAKKKDVENNLKQRKEINVDPFQSKYYLQGRKWLCIYMYIKISDLLNQEGTTVNQLLFVATLLISYYIN